MVSIIAGNSIKCNAICAFPRANGGAFTCLTLVGLPCFFCTVTPRSNYISYDIVICYFSDVRCSYFQIDKKCSCRADSTRRNTPPCLIKQGIERIYLYARVYSFLLHLHFDSATNIICQPVNECDTQILFSSCFFSFLSTPLKEQLLVLTI